MRIARQNAASRANAQKSTGPRTEFGKAASRFNALKHGIDAQPQIVFTESAAAPAELAAEYHQHHGPANTNERFLADTLVDTLVNNEWRLRRLRCVEADLWVVASNLFLDNRCDKLPQAGSGDAFKAARPTFERLQRVVNSCERNYHRALKELQRLQAARSRAEEAAEDAAQPPASTPQPEESTSISQSSASFRTNPQSAPKPPSARPESPKNPVIAGANARPSGPDLAQNLRQAA